MASSPSEQLILEARAALFPKISKVLMVQSIVTVTSLAVAVGALGLAFLRKPVVVGVTDSGRVVPLVALDQPYVNDSRVVSFSAECLSRAFSHDFVNYRASLADTSNCFTPDGNKEYQAAIAPYLDELKKNRMVMSATFRPPVVMQTRQVAGVYTWALETELTLYREGTTTRMTPSKYQVQLLIERVGLDQDPRGLSVSQFVVKPLLT